jgi:hypothetical protein
MRLLWGYEFNMSSCTWFRWIIRFECHQPSVHKWMAYKSLFTKYISSFCRNDHHARTIYCVWWMSTRMYEWIVIFRYVIIIEWLLIVIVVVGSMKNNEWNIENNCVQGCGYCEDIYEQWRNQNFFFSGGHKKIILYTKIWLSINQITYFMYDKWLEIINN